MKINFLIVNFTFAWSHNSENQLISLKTVQTRSKAPETNFSELDNSIIDYSVKSKREVHPRSQLIKQECLKRVLPNWRSSWTSDWAFRSTEVGISSGLCGATIRSWISSSTAAWRKWKMAKCARLAWWSFGETQSSCWRVWIELGDLLSSSKCKLTLKRLILPLTRCLRWTHPFWYVDCNISTDTMMIYIQEKNCDTYLQTWYLWF